LLPFYLPSFRGKIGELLEYDHWSTEFGTVILAQTVTNKISIFVEEFESELR